MNQGLSIYLDLMRLLAAGMVFTTHMNSDSVAGPLLWRISGHSGEGVIILFVLSGFVISYVTSRPGQAARGYFVARAARIYSVAVLAIPITLAMDAIGAPVTPTLYYGHSYFNPNTGIGDILGSLTFINELWSNHIIVGSNEPYWSLGFEVWYYLIFAVVFFAPGRIGPVCAIVLPGWPAPRSRYISLSGCWAV